MKNIPVANSRDEIWPLSFFERMRLPVITFVQIRHNNFKNDDNNNILGADILGLTPYRIESSCTPTLRTLCMPVSYR